MSETKKKLMLKEPKQARARATYEKLLNAAGILLMEKGIEGISTNAIAEKAGVTPPAFYRYFTDKYDILTVLGYRLMNSQNTLILDILQDSVSLESVSLKTSQIERLISNTLSDTEAFPGGRWIMRSLRAIPSLQNIRIESHNEMASAITDGYRQIYPEVDRSELYRQARLTIEIAYCALELIFDDPILDRKAIIRDSAKAVSAFFMVID